MLDLFHFFAEDDVIALTLKTLALKARGHKEWIPAYEATSNNPMVKFDTFDPTLDVSWN